MEVLLSGTVGAATYAAYNAGIPAIAFSGATGSQTAWNASSTFPAYSQVYADLSLNLTDVLVASGTPYLPNDVRVPYMGRVLFVNELQLLGLAQCQLQLCHV